MSAYLVLDFEASMSSFGGDAVDSRGVVRDFPARSMLAGMIGNALGLERGDAEALDMLQSRLTYAAALVRTGQRRREYQTARLFESETGWTTGGFPEGRTKSPSFAWDARYEIERDDRLKSLTHQRYRDYDMDARTFVVMTLLGVEKQPTLEDVAQALRFPTRPLFIGRKACIPSGPLLQGTIEASNTIAALVTTMNDAGYSSARVQWDDNENMDQAAVAVQPAQEQSSAYKIMGERVLTICDERQHTSGVHAGTRKVFQGNLSLPTGTLSDDALEIHSLSNLMGDLY